MNLVMREYLKERATGTEIRDYSMTKSTSTYYSKPLLVHNSQAVCSLRLKTSAGSLSVTYEVADNDMVFYEPYSVAGQKVNKIVSRLSADRWVDFRPVLCEYMRFKFVLTAADSTVSAIYRQLEA